MLNSETTGRQFIVARDVLNVRRQTPDPITGSMFQPVYSANGVPVTHGAAVYDYDWRHGYVDLTQVLEREYSDGWFEVKADPADVGNYAVRGSLMNGERVSTVHWSTRKPATDHVR